MRAYRRSPLSLILLLLVCGASLITMLTLLYLIFYILVKGIPYITPDLFSFTYTSDNVSLMPALISTIVMTIIALVIALPGEMLGDHHMSQKNLFFEGSAHVPLLIMPPQGRSLPQNISVEAPTDLVDLYPTILAMAGLSSPVSVSGRNLLEPVPMDRIFFGNSLNRNFCVMDFAARAADTARRARGTACLRRYFQGSLRRR